MIKIAALAVSGVMLALTLKQTKPEYSIVIGMAVCICIFIYVMSKLQVVLGYLKQLETAIHVDSVYLDIILKMLGITY